MRYDLLVQIITIYHISFGKHSFPYYFWYCDRRLRPQESLLAAIVPSDGPEIRGLTVDTRKYPVLTCNRVTSGCTVSETLKPRDDKARVWLRSIRRKTGSSQRRSACAVTPATRSGPPSVASAATANCDRRPARAGAPDRGARCTVVNRRWFCSVQRVIDMLPEIVQDIEVECSMVRIHNPTEHICRIFFKKKYGTDSNR